MNTICEAENTVDNSVNSPVKLITSEHRQSIAHCRQTLADVGVNVDVDSTHLPLHIQNPFGIRRRRVCCSWARVDGAWTHLVRAMRHNKCIHHNILLRIGLPVIPRYLEVIGKAQAKSYKHYFLKPVINTPCLSAFNLEARTHSVYLHKWCNIFTYTCSSSNQHINTHPFKGLFSRTI